MKRWFLFALLVTGSTGCLTIHVHVPPPEPVVLSPYPPAPYAAPYGAPPPAAVPPGAETGSYRRPIDQSLEDDHRLASCEPPYRITPQGIRVIRAECISQ